VKRVFNKKIAVAGGINNAVTVEQGTPDEIRQAVFDAISILGPGGGFILTPVDSINASTPWANIEVLIEAWKEARDYPLR
jgi:uroporphyrinogen decarboxylase